MNHIHVLHLLVEEEERGVGRGGRGGGRQLLHAIIVPVLASSENSVLRIDRELQYS